MTRYDARPSARSAAFSAINPDFNGAAQEGAGLHQHNVRGGLRFNTRAARRNRAFVRKFMAARQALRPILQDVAAW